MRAAVEADRETGREEEEEGGGKLPRREVRYIGRGWGRDRSG